MAEKQNYNQKCSAVGSYSYASNFKLYVELEETSVSTSDNTSKVKYNVYCQSSGSGSISSKHLKYFKINGDVIINETVSVSASSPNALIKIASGTTGAISHKSDGSKTISFTAQIKASSYGVSASINKDFELTKIERYFTSTPGFSKKSKTETTFTFNWSTSETCSQVILYMGGKQRGKLENISAKSGTITGTGLSANTSYDTYLVCTRKDSGKTTNTSTKSYTTYSYPYCSSAPNFNIGDNVTLDFYNPLNRPLSIQMYSYASNSFVSDKINIGSVSYYIGFSEIASSLYSSIPNQQKSQYNIDVYYGENKAIKQGGEYQVRGTETPIFNSGFEVVPGNYNTLRGEDSESVIIGYSDIIVTMGQRLMNQNSAQNYASLKQMRVDVGSKNATGSISFEDSQYSGSSVSISAVPSNEVKATLIDSRGLSASKTIVLNALNYYKPTIASISATRVDYVTSRVILTFAINFWNQKFGTASDSVQNSIKKLFYRYRKTTDSNWTEEAINLDLAQCTVSGSTLTGSFEIQGDLGVDGFNVDNAYQIILTEKDALEDLNNSETHAIATVLTGSPAIAIKGKSVAIGKKIEREGMFDVGLPIRSTSVFYDYGGEIQPLPSGNDDRDYWNYLPNGIYWYGNSGSVPNMPALYGFVEKRGFCGPGDFTVLFYTQNQGPIYRKSGNVNGVTGWKSICIIAKDGSAGAGLINSDGTSIIRDCNNTNVTVDATGGVLCLGFQNTNGINFLNGKVSINNEGKFYYNHNGLYAPNGSGIYLNEYGNIITQKTMTSGEWKVVNNGTALLALAFSNNYCTLAGGLRVSDNLTVNGAIYVDSASIRSQYIYNNQNVDNSPNLYITSNGWFRRTSGSSKRWKTDITEEIEDRLNPVALYSLPIKQFKYKNDCLSKDSVRYGKNILGFIAEDVAEIYEPAAQYDEDGNVEMWNAQVMIPAMLKLIQEQKKEIDILKKQIKGE